jgi:hypothetical protein
MKTELSDIEKAETRFLTWARSHGLKYKVEGATAYSSRPMGIGRYARLVSAKGGVLVVAMDGKLVMI